MIEQYLSYLSSHEEAGILGSAADQGKPTVSNFICQLVLTQHACQITYVIKLVLLL